MYEAFYGLHTKPFSILPDPNFLYWAGPHSMAFSMLEYGILNHAGFTVITGEIGSGKTTLVLHLIDRLPGDITVGVVSNTQGDRGDLLQWLMMAFGQEFEGISYVGLHKKFEEFLSKQHARKWRTVLIIDEAQNLGVKALEELRMMSNVNASNQELLQIVLVGQPELKALLNRPELMQFAQRVSSDFHLGLLAREDVPAYIDHRLNVAGASRLLFDDEACERVYFATQGTPRLINVLCDTALMYGFATDAEVITGDIVQSVIEDKRKYGVFQFGQNRPKERGPGCGKGRGIVGSVRSAPTVLSVWLKAIVADLREHGRNVDKILHEAGLDLRSVNRERGRIPSEAQARLMEVAARELGDDCYSVHLAAKVDVRDANALAYLGLASRTLGDALGNLARYARIFNEAVRIELASDDEGQVTVGLSPVEPSFAMHRQQMEFTAALLLRAYRFFTKRDITPIEVNFVHSRRDKLPEVARFFGCTVSYRQNRAQIVLKAKDMATSITTADDRLLKILRAHCDAMLKEHGTQDAALLQKVERRVVDLLPKGAAKAKVIATDLGVSERTLTRQLASVGTNFKGVLGRLRHQLALKYVTGSDLSLTQVAFLLGYASEPAFCSAFRRWSGKAPSKLRSQ